MVPLSKDTYERFQEWAKLHQLEMGEAIARFLDETPPPINDLPLVSTDIDPQIVQEREAFLRLHPQLKQTYLGEYVAIYQGKMVDHDKNRQQLMTRIREKYPHEVVLVRPVQAKAEIETRQI